MNHSPYIWSDSCHIFTLLNSLILILIAVWDALCLFPGFWSLGPSIVQSPIAAALPVVVEKFEQEKKKKKTPWRDTKPFKMNVRALLRLSFHGQQS